MKPFPEAAAALRQSPIRAVTFAVDRVGGINLGQGICDLPTPAPIREGAVRSLDRGVSTYTAYAGIPRLRAAIADKARRFNGLPVTSDDEVVVSVGSTGAFAATLLALCEAGDEVVVFEPVYGYHVGLLRLFGITPVAVPLRGDAFAFDPADLAAAVTPRTTAIVLCTPANPSGKVWTEEEIRAVYAVADRHDLWVVTDEIYEYLTYDGHRHVSPASLSQTSLGGDAYARTVTISGFSKTYNMTGWRLGYAVAPAAVAERIGLVSDLLYVCAPAPLQEGVAEAFAMGDGYFDDLRADYAARRTTMMAALDACGFGARPPDGAYYVLADIRPLAARLPGFDDDLAAAATLIDRAGVGTVAGSGFFLDPARGRHLLRFCYAKDGAVLDEACARLVAAFGR